MNELLIALMWIRCEHHGHPSTLLSSNHISINNSQPGFASRYARAMIGLSVRAVRELLQFGTIFLFLFSSTVCISSFSFALPSLSSASSFFPSTQNHATFHPFIHFSHDGLVSSEKDWLYGCICFVLCVSVCVYVCRHGSAKRFSLMPEMACNFRNCRPAPHFK